MRTSGKSILLALSLLIAAYGAPAGIVEEAVDAASRDDRSAYIACFTPRSRPLLRSLYAVADAERPELGRLGNSGATITEVRHMSPGEAGQRRAVVTVSEGGQTLPVVVHAEAGAWRIDLMDTERALTGFGSAF